MFSSLITGRAGACCFLHLFASRGMLQCEQRVLEESRGRRLFPLWLYQLGSSSFQRRSNIEAISLVF